MMVKLELKSDQDGMGFWYGSCLDHEGKRRRVDILPPKSEPRPHFVISHSLMHETDWIVYLDGEEIARLSRRDEAQAAITKHLST